MCNTEKRDGARELVGYKGKCLYCPATFAVENFSYKYKLQLHFFTEMEEVIFYVYVCICIFRFEFLITLLNM